MSNGTALETVFVYHAPLVAMAGAAFFVAFYGIGSNFVWGLPARAIHFVAQNAIGGFFFHIFFIDQVYARGFVPDFINPWIGIPISSAMVWGASLIASTIARAALWQVSPTIELARQTNSRARHDGSHSLCSFARCELFWPTHWPAGSHWGCAAVFPRPAAAVREF